MKRQQSNRQGPLTYVQQNNSYQGGQDDKKIRQEVTEKDNKIKELNNVISQLQQKLQDKITENQKEQQEKNKYKELYEKYQNEVVRLEAQIEEGNFSQPKKTEDKKLAAVT